MHLIGSNYPDTGAPVSAGGRMQVDGNSGLIVQVCHRNTELAKDFACEQTNELLVKFDDGILALLPFGATHHFVKGSS